MTSRLLSALLLAIAVTWQGPARAQEVDCLSLLSGGFVGMSDAVRRHVTGARCNIRDQRTIDGRDYVFAEVVGDGDPAGRARLAQAAEAVYRAVPLYNSWFRTPSAVFLSGRAPAFTDYAETDISRGRGCLIWLDHASRHGGLLARDSDANQYKRTIAHELFHCVHLTDPTLDNTFLQWRDEGASEYFAGLAVPAARPNAGQYADFHKIEIKPLYELKLHAFPFFAFLGRERGVDAVIDFMRGASRSHTTSGHRASLYRIPNIEELFAKLGRKFARNTLEDEMGRALGIGPVHLRPRVRVDRAQTLRVEGIKPFTLTLVPATFAAGMAWQVMPPDASTATKIQWNQEGADSGWKDLPTTIDACGGDKPGYFLLSSTRDSDSAQTITAAINEKPEGMVTCPCPQGTWTMGLESLRAMPPWFPGDLVAGSITLRFSRDEAVATFNDVTYKNKIDRYSSMRAVLTGSVYWNYSRKPWSAAQLGAAPAGRGVDAFSVERILQRTDARTRVEFVGRSGPIRSRETPFKSQQNVGGKNLTGAYCVDGRELHLVSSRASVLPGSASTPPYTGVYVRN